MQLIQSPSLQESTVRKTLATLLAIASGVAAFGSMAGVAAADDPGAYYFNDGYSAPGFVSYSRGCKTPYRYGVLTPGMPGAWGYFIDGCTTGKVSCPTSGSRCTILDSSYIDTQTHRGDQVTMNARIRFYDRYGREYYHSDRSCIGTDVCGIRHSFYNSFLSPGESATVQCNGVRAITSNTAQDTCKISIKSI
jgi:hypothetical protein